MRFLDQKSSVLQTFKMEAVHQQTHLTSLFKTVERTRKCKEKKKGMPSTVHKSLLSHNILYILNTATNQCIGKHLLFDKTHEV